MDDPELARAIGRIEQQVETLGDNMDKLGAKLERVDDRLGRVERAGLPLRRQLEGLETEARARSKQVEENTRRLTALEAPIAQAKLDSASRRELIRKRVKRVGGVLASAFVVIEWVAKPIVGFLTEQWMRGNPPPGH